MGEKKTLITKDTKIAELLEIAPDKVDLLYEVGMHCIGCMAAADETIGEACMVHGIDADELVEELNKED